MKTILTAERLRELLNYDPETGIFRWDVVRRGCGIGKEAGTSVSAGYRQISIDRRAYSEHRLARLYVHGHWPLDEIDHINGVRDDNRLSNLRQATRSENAQNQRRAQSRSKIGILGVTLHRGKFQAQI